MTARLKIVFLLGILANALAGCGGGGGGGGGGGPAPAPAVSLSPTSLTFAIQDVGTTSSAQSVTLSNSGSASLSISSIGLAGSNASDFAQSNTCGATLAAGANCSISVTFTPTATGSRSASLSIATNAATSPSTVALSGSAGAVTATLSPSTVVFASTYLNTASAAQTVTLTNGGTGPLAINSVSVTGANAGDFAANSRCGTTLAANSNCTITVTFTPTAVGSRVATLSVATDAPGSPATLTLGGIGDDNSLAVTIDQGPLAATSPTGNILYASVTVCTPGSTTQCTTIDHIQVDTGSFGLRLFSSVLGTATPAAVNDRTTGRALWECVQYADGYTWGAVGALDVTIGPRKLASLPVNLMADQTTASTPAVPSDCSSYNGQALTSDNTRTAFGANGILGIGVFPTDCGPACASGLQPGFYYTCPSSGCVVATVAEADQIHNPLTLSADGNNTNGVVFVLPPSTTPTNTLTGKIYFGVGTEPNNTPPASQSWFTLDPSYGTFTTNYKGTLLTQSFVDSGSNGFFFSDATIAGCTGQLAGFYCPTSQVLATASVLGLNQATTDIPFTIDSAQTMFAAYPNAAAFPDLGGTLSSSPTAPSNAFDWGSPFFFGRTVYHLFSGNSYLPTGASASATVSGPALAF